MQVFIFAGQYRVIENALAFPINFNQLFNFVIFPTQISQNFYRAAKSFKLCVLRKKKLITGFVEHFRAWRSLRIEQTGWIFGHDEFCVQRKRAGVQFLSMPQKYLRSYKEKLKFQGNSIWNFSVFSITTIHSFRDTINIIKDFFSLNFM